MTHTHPRVRGGLVARAASLGFGLFVFSVGIVFILDSLSRIPFKLSPKGEMTRRRMLTAATMKTPRIT